MPKRIYTEGAHVTLVAQAAQYSNLEGVRVECVPALPEQRAMVMAEPDERLPYASLYVVQVIPEDRIDVEGDGLVEVGIEDIKDTKAWRS